MFCRTILIYCIFRIITIQKPTDLRIIITALEIVQSRILIIVVPTVAEGVDGGDVDGGDVHRNGGDAPRVVAIARDDLAVRIGDGDDVTLQILLEIVRGIVENTTHAVLVVVIILLSRRQVKGTHKAPALQMQCGGLWCFRLRGQ